MGTMTLDQKILIKGFLERYGLHGPQFLRLTAHEAVYWVGRLFPYMPIPELWTQRKLVRPRRHPEPRWRMINRAGPGPVHCRSRVPTGRGPINSDVGG